MAIESINTPPRRDMRQDRLGLSQSAAHGMVNDRPRRITRTDHGITDERQIVSSDIPVSNPVEMTRYEPKVDSEVAQSVEVYVAQSADKQGDVPAEREIVRFPQPDDDQEQIGQVIVQRDDLEPVTVLVSPQEKAQNDPEKGVDEQLLDSIFGELDPEGKQNALDRVDKLSDDERRLLKERFGNKAKLKDLGKKYNVTHQAVAARVRKAVDKLSGDDEVKESERVSQSRPYGWGKKMGKEALEALAQQVYEDFTVNGKTYAEIREEKKLSTRVIAKYIREGRVARGIPVPDTAARPTKEQHDRERLGYTKEEGQQTGVPEKREVQARFKVSRDTLGKVLKGETKGVRAKSVLQVVDALPEADQKLLYDRLVLNKRYRDLGREKGVTYRAVTQKVSSLIDNINKEGSHYKSRSKRTAGLRRAKDQQEIAALRKQTYEMITVQNKTLREVMGTLNLSKTTVSKYLRAERKNREGGKQ